MLKITILIKKLKKIQTNHSFLIQITLHLPRFYYSKYPLSISEKKVWLRHWLKKLETVLLIYNFHKRHVSTTHPLSGKLSSPFNLNNMGIISNHSNLPLKREPMTHDGANHNSLWHFSN